MSEETEEEFLVYVNFDPHITSQDLENNPRIKIIGIDEETPIIEINGKIFECSYDFSIGTNLFFEKDLNPPQLDPLYDKNPKEMYTFAAKTTKILKTKRIFVEKNVSDNDNPIQEVKMEKDVDVTYPDLILDSEELDRKKMSYEEMLEELVLSATQFNDEDTEGETNIDSDSNKDENNTKNTSADDEKMN